MFSEFIIGDHSGHGIRFFNQMASQITSESLLVFWEV